MKRRIDINLLPPEFRPAPAVRWLPPYLAFVYSIGAFLLLWVIFAHFAHVNSLKTDVKSLEKSVASYKPFEEAYEKSKLAIQDLEKLKKVFNALEATYVDWPLFLRKLEGKVPSGVWLTSISAQTIESETKEIIEKPKPAPAGAAAQPAAAEAEAAPKKEKTLAVHKGKLVIEGNTALADLVLVSKFLENLREDPFFVEPVLQSTRVEEEEEGGRRYYSFSVSTNLILPEEQGEKKQSSSESSTGKTVSSAEGVT